MARLDLSLSLKHLFPLQSVLTLPCGLHGRKSIDARGRGVGAAVGGGVVTITRLCEAEDNHRANRSPTRIE
jgi:hypothetical protein